MTPNAPPPGLPDSCKPCWETIEELKLAIERIEARRGFVNLTLQGWVAIIGLALVVGGSATALYVGIARLDESVQSARREVATLSNMVSRHLDAPGHQVSITKIEQLERDVQDLKNRRYLIGR